MKDKVGLVTCEFWSAGSDGAAIDIRIVGNRWGRVVTGAAST